MLKRELVRGIVISNTCVKLYRNWIINEVARAGEHTNERTYVLTYIRTGQTLYPLHNFVVRGDNKAELSFLHITLCTDLFYNPTSAIKIYLPVAELCSVKYTNVSFMLLTGGTKSSTAYKKLSS